MHSSKTIFIGISCFSLICGVISCANDWGKFSLIEEYYKLTGEYKNPPSKTLKIDITDYVRSLNHYYKSDPISCLDEAFWMRDFASDEFFFEVITSEPFYVQKTFYFLYLPQKRVLGFEKARKNCENIKKAVYSCLYKPWKSNDDMEVKFSVINLLIRFIERYQNSIISLRSDEKYMKELSREIIRWKSVMNYILSHSSNGAINYNYFFSTFYKFVGAGVVVFPKYNEGNSKYYLLLATSLHHIIRKKDTKIFEIDHPELPFFSGSYFEES